MDYTKTNRGFDLIEFKDADGQDCSLQQSSTSSFKHEPGEEFIYLGINKPQPIILAREAQAAGIKTSETVGYIEVPQPNGTFINGRMHLNVEQAKELAMYLNRWAETGALNPNENILNKEHKNPRAISTFISKLLQLSKNLTGARKDK